MLAFILGAIGAALAFLLHNWVERRFKIDDVVGAVAVHGYAGFFGIVAAGFLLWGYPAAAPGPEGDVAWFTTPDGWPMINPLGNFLGAIIMFFVLGFVPGFVVAKILDALGWLRVPRAVEAAGLDAFNYGDVYPYLQHRETQFEIAERAAAREALLTNGRGARTEREVPR